MILQEVDFQYFYLITYRLNSADLILIQIHKFLDLTECYTTSAHPALKWVNIQNIDNKFI